jgi:hypothetical protein
LEQLINYFEYKVFSVEVRKLGCDLLVDGIERQSFAGVLAHSKLLSDVMP